MQCLCLFNAAFNIWCDITFTLPGNSDQAVQIYKNITIPDDDTYVFGPQQEVNLTLGSTDPNVVINPLTSRALVTVLDNDSKL